ncbi:hypothetical protein JR316_0007960 [Psilocybe cubensis]|uniref:Uncharacterized protein n=1 Tax=Psilocybe cubensis TaxID=181762 RepID=A0ACB8GV67_PSICU|nr:hypothetical protein JR316_0007960 [Psilocybe cubensis]KAH9479370.1 hypothetical protein JR316_0007960 [Psilocybe cubensis]
MFAGILSLVGVNGYPLEPHGHNMSQDAVGKFISEAKNGVPAAPHFVIYSDAPVSGETGPPPVSQIQGFNVFALSFLLTNGAFDKALEWTKLSDSQRTTIKSQYAAAGIKLIVSVFGSTDAPTTKGADPVATANTMAAWVKKYQLDGVDVDYEDFDAINAGNGKGELLHHGKYYELPGINSYNEYQQVLSWKVWRRRLSEKGSSEYTTCTGLLTASSSTWPQSSLFQISANGVPLSKLVIGKPALTSDASNGFMSTSTLASCVSQAKAKGWSAGVMVWEFPDAAASWINAVRAQAFPE